jgi:N-methylhydantoinase B
MMGQAIRQIPRGKYRSSFRIDDDGSGNGLEYEVVLTVTANGDSIEVDFEGTSDQAAGIINSSYSQTMAATMFGIYACVGLDLPLDEGSFRRVSMNLPFGSLVNPRAPAACNGRIVTGTAIVEAVLAALSQADEQLAMAASGIVHVYTMGGRDEDGRHWGFLNVEMGGSGARFGLDGPDAVSAAMFGGGRLTTDVEPLESRFPVLFERSSLLRDSGGPGRWRGGVGTETVVRVLEEASVTVRTDRVRLAPPGLAGGEPGRPGSYAIRRANGRTDRLAAKAMNISLAEGDVLIMRTTGGGGVGKPSERDRSALERDVRGKLVSPRAAREEYGAESTTTFTESHLPATSLQQPGPTAGRSK